MKLNEPKISLILFIVVVVSVISGIVFGVSRLAEPEKLGAELTKTEKIDVKTSELLKSE